MLISSFRLRNYKSYLDSADVKLSPGINLIVGQNDAGKSALLEGLSLHFNNNPHRDSVQRLSVNDQNKQESTADVFFTVSKEELWGILRDLPGSFCVPLPESETLFEKYSPALPEHRKLLERYEITPSESINEVDCARIFILTLLDGPTCEFQVCYKCKDQPHIVHIPNFLYGWNNAVFPAICGYVAAGTQNKRVYASCQINQLGKLVIDRENEWLDRLGTTGEKSFDLIRTPQLIRDSDDQLDVGLVVAENLRQRVYLFQAQRVVKGRCRQGYSKDLASDAQDLASFLANVQRTPTVFREINARLRAVLPQIFEVSIRPVPSDYLSGPQRQEGLYEILVYQQESRFEQDAIPLDDCGTGVGQVLAILSIVVASPSSRTIIIDEPQSFLHPGAIRKLIEILKSYPQHQYIISTHSPQLITSANPSTIILVTKGRGEPSKLQPLDPVVQQDIELCLREVGARLSDVFGADQVLWVEGPTKTACFPLIVQKLLDRPLLGTAIVPVDSTGDLEGKQAERVIKIYERLSKGIGLIPRTLAFVFDRENRTETQISDLERRLRGNRVRCLKRTMIENYFLNAEAILSVLVQCGVPADNHVSIEQISAWLNKRLEGKDLESPQVKRYFNKVPLNKRGIDTVHGGHLLEDLFSNFSGKTVPYDKPRHGLKLTEWLIEHNPQALGEVKELLAQIFPNE